MADGTIITSVTDTLAVCSSIIESAKNEVIYISPPSLLVLSSEFSLAEKTKQFIQRGGRVRGIADFSYPYIETMRESLNNGEEVRHFSEYLGIFMLVGDKRESISSMGASAENLSIDAPVVVLWSDSPTFADFLVSTFDTTWERAIPATQRIEELLKEGPPKV